ncbi:alpha-terpineol synthase, chloroplastic-like [Punica granatum]|uniref:Alpha-terpineol synthase, chloroplastic-like n=1 Tax=Punica granatum TaxID=22663 RepID=A0A6P8D2V8_PUNGR|nr:alpha-terpineol synthase, chloroplastic-like [Punica granatum]
MAAQNEATTLSINNLGEEVIRRSANFQPSVWDYGFVQSLGSEYSEIEEYAEEVERMKGEVKRLINSKEMDSLSKLELIDCVRRLGLGYHFEEEIEKAMSAIYDEKAKFGWGFEDLNSSSLGFRLLRQHKFLVCQDVFERFTDDKGSFGVPSNEDGVKGLLSLYEASFHALEGEMILDNAKAFSSTCLMNVKKDINMSPSLARKVDHALDMPIHWRPNRLEARWFINAYEGERDRNPILLKLAKLDYNMVQSIHKKEVSELARWWVDLGVNNLAFARDRLMEHYLWNALVVFEPQFGACREMTTKIICLVTAMDDVYDVFGTLEELEILTDFVDRWDISEIGRLPPAIRTCYLAMYDISNDINQWTIKERGFSVIPYIHKMWADQTKALLKEAKWYHARHKPRLQEYLKTSVTSIGGLLMMLCCYLLTTNKITKEALDFISEYPSIMFCSTAVVRLNNDLATSSDEMERGDNYKSIQCYMNESAACEEAARQHVKGLVWEMWKNMNRDVCKSYPITGPFLNACLNLARAAQCFYQYGDGHGVPGGKTKNYLMSVLVRPVPIQELIGM